MNTNHISDIIRDLESFQQATCNKLNKRENAALQRIIDRFKNNRQQPDKKELAELAVLIARIIFQGAAWLHQHPL